MLDPDLELRQIAAQRKIARANRLYNLHPVFRTYIFLFSFVLGVTLYAAIPLVLLTGSVEAWVNLFWPLALGVQTAIVMFLPVYGYGVYRITGPVLDVLDWMTEGSGEFEKELAAIEVEARRRLHELGP